MTAADEAWRRLARADPYGAVLAHRSREEFFASGERHIEALLGIVREQIDPGYRPVRALDFGCGVGRILVPLSRLCEEVVGVDVSEEMLAEARQNCNERSLGNVQLAPTVDPLVAAASFDLVHSYIVLQHIPRKRGLAIISQLVDLVAVGGIGALHLQYARDAPLARKLVNSVRARVPFAHDLINVLQGQPARAPLMQMNVYPLDDVFRLLQLKQCHNVVLRFSETETGGYLGVILIFRKEPRNLLAPV